MTRDNDRPLDDRRFHADHSIGFLKNGSRQLLKLYSGKFNRCHTQVYIDGAGIVASSPATMDSGAGASGIFGRWLRIPVSTRRICGACIVTSQANPGWSSTAESREVVPRLTAPRHARTVLWNPCAVLSLAVGMSTGAGNTCRSQRASGMIVGIFTDLFTARCFALKNKVSPARRASRFESIRTSGIV